MVTMKEPNLRRLEDKLSKTSFPTELTCVNLLMKRDWDVSNNFIFEDPEQQKSREIDIFACDAPEIFDNKSCMSIYLLVECKKSDHPWIFYPSSDGRRKSLLGAHEMIWKQGGNKGSKDQYGGLVSSLLWKSRFMDSRIFSWFFEEDGRQHKIYDAISKLAKATNYITAGQREGFENLDPPLLFVVYQAIVLDGLLCQGSLTGKKVHLTPMEHLVLATEFSCPAFRTHMLIDVVHAGFFFEYVKIIEAERKKYVQIANSFYQQILKEDS